MRTPGELVASLRQRGVHIWADAGQVRLRSPKGAIRPDEVAELRACRAQIIEHLDAVQALAALPMLPRASGAFAPLTATQRMPWYRTGMTQPRRRTSSLGLRVRGSARVELLRRSLLSLIERHEPLRTRIVAQGETLLQRIDASGADHIALADLSHLQRSKAERVAREHMQEFIDRPVDFAITALFEACILKLADDDHLLVLSVDQLASDGVSLELLKQELWELYSELSTAGPGTLVQPTLHFADYAAWQQQAHALWRKVHESYWQARLANSARLRWPAAKDSQHEDRRRFVTREAPLGPQLTRDLLRLAQSERTLPALVVLTGFLAAASLWCNERDLTVAMVDSGRYRAELIRMIGCLVNHLHLRVRPMEYATLADLLELTRREFDSACQHRDLDWVPALVPDLSADLLFNWAPAAGTGAESATNELRVGSERLALELVPLRIDEAEVGQIMAHTPFKVMVFCLQSAEEITTYVSGDANCFTAEGVAKFAASLRVCLEALVRQPLARLETLSAYAP